MNDTIRTTARLGWAAVALALATTISVAPAAAQGKPDFAGKPGVTGKDAEKGDRGRSDAAKDMARERGQGEKKGLYKDDDKGKGAGKDEKAKKGKKKDKKKKDKKKKSEIDADPYPDKDSGG